ncbi:MAG: prenyltransferase/squalene oxidase repeat-containing protein, partial [Acidobacteriota bacterium]
MRDGLLAASTKGPVPLGTGEWQGDVFVLPYTFGETYDSETAAGVNSAPRRWVSESFFNQNADRYDFLVVFTNFDWNAGDGVRGLYWSVANDVEGIGLELFDLSASFGSQRLQGYIDGYVLSDYVRQDGSLDERRIAEILNHELGHRFLAYPDVDGGALIGRDGAHWSYLLDTDASYLYGSDWTDNGDGTFTATSTRERFSNLDLYLMGLLPAEDVAPVTLLENPDVDTTQLPGLGDTVSATARTVGLGELIGAEGPRVPAVDVAPKEFRLGVVYLVAPDQPIQAADAPRLEALRDIWERSFFRQTRGRALIDIDRHGELPPGGSAADLDAALAWLAGRTGAFGLWQDSSTTLLRDSAEAIEALSRAGGFGDVISEALIQLPRRDAGAAELRYRQLEALARFGGAAGDVASAADAARAEAVADGGWPAFPRYRADAVTTARAVRALAAAGRGLSAESGWDWLRGRQNADGGWGWQEESPSSVAVTLEVLMASRALYRSDFWQRPEVTAAVDWLLARQLDGGFGDTFPNVTQTALFLQFTEGQPVNQGAVQAAVDFLVTHQQLD